MLDEAYMLPDPSVAFDAKQHDKYFNTKREVKVVSASDDGNAKLYEFRVTVSWPPSSQLVLTGLRSVYEHKK
jgi:hypothetical protein